ncbi:MAG: LamG-like jellyroll fold domain-containing protein, partial [Spirochaetales bacterium]
TLYIAKQDEAAATGELLSEDQTSGSSLDRTTLIQNDPFGIPLVTNSPPTDDLGTLYAAIENGALLTADSKTGEIAYQFNGQQGMVFNDTSGSAYGLTNVGAIEAWIKLYDRIPWAAVVHKGVKDDFSDEVYSLQFWSKGNDLAFVLNPQGSGKYILVQAGSTFKNLALNTCYYVVATWNKDNMDLYVNGQCVGRKSTFIHLPGNPTPVYGIKMHKRGRRVPCMRVPCMS